MHSDLWFYFFSGNSRVSTNSPFSLRRLICPPYFSVAERILLLLLLCSDAQLQHGALFLLSDGIAQKADVYQQRQHTAPGQKHRHGGGQFFIGQRQPIGEPTDKQIGNSGQNIQCKCSAAKDAQLFSRAETAQQPQQRSLHGCQWQIRQQRRPECAGA